MNTPTRACALPHLDPASYRRHALHGETAVWQEKNCYIDLWIELVHALGADPHAMLGITLPVDFEGDQWTFFKPSHDEIRQFYGVDVQELTLWRPLAEHAIEHLGAGKLLCVETDAYWLPDTAGTDYRQKNTKTSIVLADIDLTAKRLVYLHNAGCYALEGEDFDRIFRLGQAEEPGWLPLFAEVVRIDRLTLRPADELRAMARARLPDLLQRLPHDNPMHRFAARFEQELPELRARGLAHYHAWAFGAIRQCGAAFELTARWLDWMAPERPPEMVQAAQQFDLISTGCKTLILKAARVVASSKPVDTSALFGGLAGAWEQGVKALEGAVKSA